MKKALERCIPKPRFEMFTSLPNKSYFKEHIGETVENTDKLTFLKFPTF